MVKALLKTVLEFISANIHFTLVFKSVIAHLKWLYINFDLIKM